MKTTEGIVLSSNKESQQTSLPATESRAQTLARLKSQLGARLFVGDSDPDRSTDLVGKKSVATGLTQLDHSLARGGFPCGELSFLVGKPGLGCTSLWIEAARLQTCVARARVCWINHGSAQINPVALKQRGVQLENLFLVSPPQDSKQRVWLLRELLESQLFSLIAVDLGDERLPVREARSWLPHVRRSGAAVVTCFRMDRAHQLGALREFAQVIVEAHSTGFELVRSVHRPTPVRIERSIRHEFDSLLQPSSNLSYRLEHVEARTVG